MFLVRHGETEWSLDGRHTSRSDLPLSAEGERRAVQLAEVFREHPFALVLTSPMGRAVRTCELAGLLSRAQISPDLREWDYGEYEGRTTPDIRSARPDWNLFHDGAPGGESAEDVGARVRRVIDRLAAVDGDAAVFGHGHSLRVLAALWTGLAPEDAERFALETGTISILGYERETRVIRMWNARA
ncbi:MAG: histidine phosphatase family protein [Phycisphaera sp.]|nr:histidine phosphatase family protein [Phycisphaera sp.]